MKAQQKNCTPPLASRRELIKTLAVLGFALPVITPKVYASNTTAPEVWVSAQGNALESFSLTWLQPNTATPQSVRTGFRGHGIAINPKQPNQIVLVARRPGTQCAVVNLERAHISHRFTLPEGHQLEGHGCFSEDGKFFYTTESQFSDGTGWIGVYNTQNYTRINQLPSYGLGPHEIKPIPNSNTLVIANGGLHTHPASGREVLNLTTMQPSLAYINSETGELLEKIEAPESTASIRHLDVASDGTVAFAMQVQRSALPHTQPVPLAASHKRGSELKLLQQPDILLHNLNDYLGSVAINNAARIVGATSPRGNLAAFWHLDTSQLMGYYSLQDVCGLAVSADQSHFVLTNSFGHIRQLNVNTLAENKALRMHFSNMHWDNHLIAT